jgi:GNAT superfamily N-acetyltransferase
MPTITPATLADLAQLADLLAVLFAQEADFTPDRARQERALALILTTPQSGAIFVAREDGELLGMVSLLFTISTAEGGQACWLEDLVVRAPRRGQGIGALLLGHAVGFARAQGFARITLLTDRLNAGARRFYARHGFDESAMMAMRLRTGAGPG